MQSVSEFRFYGSWEGWKSGWKNKGVWVIGGLGGKSGGDGACT